MNPYSNPDYTKVAPFAAFVQKAIDIANPTGQTAKPRPYEGAQFVAIPEFQGIGTNVGQTIAGTLTGQSTVDQALKTAQQAVVSAQQAVDVHWVRSMLDLYQVSSDDWEEIVDLCRTVCLRSSRQRPQRSAAPARGS